MEDSKKVQGKITEFGQRIIKVLKDNGLVKPDGGANYAQAERQCEIKGTALSKAVYAKTMHDNNMDKFLRTFQIEKEWLIHGRGPMKAAKSPEKPTHEQNQPAIKQKEEVMRETFYKDLIEENENYSLIPRAILSDYKIVPEKLLDMITQSKDDVNKALQEKHELIISGYENRINRLTEEKDKLLAENEQLKRQIPAKNQ